MASRSGKVIALSLGSGLAMVVSLLTGVVFARYLTQEGLATFRQALLAYNFVTPLLTLALPQALYFFLPKHPERDRTVLLTNVLMLTALGALFSLALALGGAQVLALRFNNPALRDVMRVFTPYPLFMFPAAALSACMVSKERVAALTTFTLVSQIVLATATITACLFRQDPGLLLAVTVGVAFITLVPSLLLMSRACTQGPWRFDAAMGWSMIKYTVPLGLSGLLGTLALQMAGVIVSSLRSPREFAVFSIGSVEIPLIVIVTGSISTVILADMARLCQNRDYTDALRLFRTAAIRSAVILLPAMMFLLAAARPFIEGLYSAKYEGSVIVFQLYLLLLPIRVVYYGPALMALGRTQQVLWRSIGDFVLTGLLCLLFVKWFGYLGAVAALLVTIYAWSVPFNLYFISKGFGVRVKDVLPLRELLHIGLLAAIPTALASTWRLLPSLPRLGQLVFAFVLYAPLAYFLLWRAGFLPTDFLAGLPVVGPWVRRIENLLRTRVAARGTS
jgi:O-antigen/teichoic acid export membrane protein